MPPVTKDISSKDEDWDAYWAHGFLTSCANAFKGNYEGRIRESWNAFFAGLPSDARLLDIATGNGAVALLASEYSLSNARHFEVHGIDRARINPASAWRGDAAVLDGVTFQGRLNAEDLPFDNAYFQAVTGQYALEYTDYGATIAELGRVVAPGGAARFILHHPESIVISTSREERAHGHLLFDETGVFSKARALLERLVAATTQGNREALARDLGAQSDRDALNLAAARISEEVASTPEPDLLTTALGHIGKAFKAAGSASEVDGALSILADGEREVRANLARLDDLLSAVVDKQKMQEIRALMDGSGFAACNPIELHFINKNKKLLMGWQLDCRRR